MILQLCVLSGCPVMWHEGYNADLWVHAILAYCIC